MAAVLTGFIFIINVALARPLIDALLFSLAIAVGIAPEMMPAIVTVSLSAGSKALAAKKVLVKRLVAIEDLGNIEILFTDKTGTLTEGVITFERALDADGQASERPLLLGLVCNEAARHGRRAGRRECAGPGPVVGSRGGGETGRSPSRRPLSRRLGVLPFDHERQLASVLVEGPGRQARSSSPRARPRWCWTGARTSPTAARRALEALFNEGARVVAVATRPAEGIGDRRAPGTSRG